MIWLSSLFGALEDRQCQGGDVARAADGLQVGVLAVHDELPVIVQEAALALGGGGVDLEVRFVDAIVGRAGRRVRAEGRLDYAVYDAAVQQDRVDATRSVELLRLDDALARYVGLLRLLEGRRRPGLKVR